MAQPQTPLTAPAPPAPSVETEYEYEGPAVHEGIPDPPKVLLEEFRRTDKIWRWMTPKHVDLRGMRGYVTYSVRAEDRAAIEAGGRFHVSVDNTVRWGEDAFLAVQPRLVYERRQAERHRRSREQTELSKSAAALEDRAARAGTSARMTVQETVGR